MSDGRIVITSDAALRADEVASRTFATSFRGYDQSEVRHYLERVSNELAAAVEREKELRAQIDGLRHQAAHPELDEETLTNALGEETASIVRSAREAAADIRAKAEQRVARMVREAEEEAARLRSEAEGVLARRVEEADAVAANLRATAEHDAQQARAAAHAEAEAELAAARTRGKEMVAEAQAVRERVLTDLARRRRIAHLQIEQLRAGRERLLEAYRVVRRTLDEATDELSVAEAEARLAAESAARKAAADVDAGAADVDAELAAARHTDESVGVGRDALPDVAGDAFAVDVAASDGPPAEAAATGVAPPDVASPDVAPPDVARPVTAPPDAAADAARPDAAPRDAARPDVPRHDVAADDDAHGERRSSTLRILRPRKPETPPPTPASLKPVQPVPVDEGVRLLRRDPAPEPVTVVDVSDVVAAPDTTIDVDAAPTETSASVAELFARIKADRAEAVARAQEVLAEPARPEPSPEVDVAAEAADADSVVPDDAPPVADDVARPIANADESALQARDRDLAPLEQALTRRLKRELQDEQNEVLERLRTVRGRPSADTVLAPGDEQRARYRHAAASILADGVGAGAGRAVVTDDAAVAELADDLASELVGELRQRLESALTDVRGSGENGEGPPDDADVVDRIGGAYRQWKTQRAESMARHYLASAWATGSYRAADDGAALRWVVDDDGPCPDCDDNALAGPTPRGERYPTGQLHPPAHPGCRCLLVPADH